MARAKTAFTAAIGGRRLEPFFQEDGSGRAGSSAWGDGRSVPPYAAGRPGGAASDSYAADQRRLRRLIWLLAILLAVFVTPLVIGRIKYEYTYNDQLAKMRVAKEQLGELELEGLSHASRLIAAGVGPSVVHIRSTQLVVARPDDETRFLWGDRDLEEYERLGDGSGVIVDDEGYIVTNHHVVAGAKSIKVVLSDGREAFADVIGSDLVSDVAVLKVDLDNLHAAEWGDSSKLDIGDLVWAMGSPFGLKQSTTFGIISAKDRTEVSPYPYQDFLQTDAAVNPGNSGGPLIGTDGKIVGINTAIVGRTFQGVSFAIPSDTAREVYQSIRENGEVPRGWLGVSMEEITPQMAERFHVPDEGALIRSVFEGSPANVARLQPGDVIIRWGEHDVMSPTELTHLVVDTPIGAEVEVAYIRGGRERTTTVRVGKRPPLELQ
jgi:S1-C subfamily serine protease